VYRTIELTDGWNGRIIQTEVYFSKSFDLSPLFLTIGSDTRSLLDVLDGAMVVLAIYVFNYCHPGRLLKATASDSDTTLPLSHVGHSHLDVESQKPQ
jgi:hypothetical protein